MNTQITLTEDQQDCLQELMNIAYGSATAAISSILDAFATLSVPQISVIDTHSLKSHLLDNIKVENSHFISSQTLNGKIAGECLFVIGEQSSINMAKEFGFENDEITQNELCDVILEITNILSSATISKLANEMANRLLTLGIYVVGFSFPVVPKGKARIRTQISAIHTIEQLDKVISAFVQVGKELKIIN